MPHFGQGKEDFHVPVVLMTLGWDPFGDPTHSEKSLGRDRSCAMRVLEMGRVVRWFTSHTRYDSHTDEKVRCWVAFHNLTLFLFIYFSCFFFVFFVCAWGEGACVCLTGFTVGAVARPS